VPPAVDTTDDQLTAALRRRRTHYTMRWLTNLTWIAYGLRSFTKQAYERAAARFDNAALAHSPANSSKLVIVTGANSGLGLAASSALARAGCAVLMVCRSEERGRAAVEAVRRESGSADVQLAVCDVSSLESVRAFAERFLRDDARPVHALVNNAGALLARRGASAEGHDLSFATNTLGGLTMGTQLLPALRKAEGSRVVFVSSGGMYTGVTLSRRSGLVCVGCL